MVNWKALTAIVKPAQVELCLSIALHGRLAVPAGRFLVVYGNSPTVVVEEPEAILGLGVALDSRLAEPPRGLAQVLTYALTVAVHPGQGRLGLRAAFLGMLPQLVERLLRRHLRPSEPETEESQEDRTKPCGSRHNKWTPYYNPKVPFSSPSARQNTSDRHRMQV